jgi:hypothetical protein
MAALTTAQLPSLTTAQISVLTADQLNALSTKALPSLIAIQIKALSTDQLNSLNSMSKLSTAQIGYLTSDQITMLDDTLFDTMSTRQLAALATQQITGLTTSQIGTFSTADMRALTINAINALSSDQMSALDATDIGALSTTQLAGMKVGTVGKLTVEQVGAFTTQQISGLTNAVLKFFSTDQLAGLTMTQVAALTSLQINALSTDQRAALTASPLILDLNGDGVHTLGIGAGVQFDIRADGKKVNTGWVGSGDGLLALDRNGDGVINDGSELFGTATPASKGGKAADGFAALAELDNNHDGVVDSKDAQYGNLRVWVDANADGVSQASELQTLASLHIASLTVAAQASDVIDEGNWIGLQSSYTSSDGSTHTLADAWFLATHTSSLTQAINSYAQQADSSAGNGAGQLTQPDSSLNNAVAALSSQLAQYHATAPLSGTATAQHDDWLRKQTSTSQGILAAK